MTIKTFRGLLADGGQDKIRVAGGKLEDGYRIVKFQMIGRDTGVFDAGFIVKIYKVEQTSVTAVIDFTDNTLLAAGYIENHENIQYPSSQSQIIFENEIFNQDIFITCVDIEAGQFCNYYLELEQVKMSGPEAAAVNFRGALIHGGLD